MKVTEFKRLAKAAFLRANPEMRDLVISTTLPAEWIDYPTGLRGLRWQFRAHANGYRPATMTATWEAGNGLMVR